MHLYFNGELIKINKYNTIKILLFPYNNYPNPFVEKLTGHAQMNEMSNGAELICITFKNIVYIDK